MAEREFSNRQFWPETENGQNTVFRPKERLSAIFLTSFRPKNWPKEGYFLAERCYFYPKVLLIGRKSFSGKIDRNAETFEFKAI